MKRTIEYKIECHKDLYSIEFEDNLLPIVISKPNSPEVTVKCGNEVILSLIGIRLSYIEII